MKNFLIIAAFLLFLFSLAIHTAEARSGCCSHHGGVCGCGCCDGTSLSAICAPYYPECNSNAPAATSNNQGNQVITPTTTLTPSPTPTVIPQPTKKPTPKPTKKAAQFTKPKPHAESFWTQLLKLLHLG